MSDLEILPHYAALAGEIRELQSEIAGMHGGIRATGEKMVLKAWEIGQKLRTARTAVKHGLWGSFLEACEINSVTAWRYVQLANEYETKDQLLATGMRKGYLSLALLPPKAAQGDSAKITGTQTGKYLRAANDLHKVLNSLEEYDRDLLKNDLRLLFKELAEFYGVIIPNV